MNIQDLLGWANSIIVSVGLADIIKAAFVVILAVLVVERFTGSRRG